MLIHGTLLAENIYTQLQKDISLLEIKPTLGAILVGENSPSMRYIRQKRRFAEQIGMNFVLRCFPEDISQEALLQEVEKLNHDTNISGYIVQLPLPQHINSLSIIEHIDPKKDVDGFHPLNQGKMMLGDETATVPCTPAGVIHILESKNISLQGKKVCIIGRSNIVGKPLSVLCINAGATVVSCNSSTPDISLYTQEADIVICAAGKAGLLTADMISKNCIVIDVGFSVIGGKIYGDACTQKIHAQ